MTQNGSYKLKGVMQSGGGVRAYQDMVLGTRSLWYLLKHELIMLIAQNTAGAMGLWLRKKLYPRLLQKCGPGCLFGRGVSLRHARKIGLGRGVVIDEGALLDAKGSGNRGLVLRDGVFIGRNTIVYTKGGDIELMAGANVSHNCELFSSNALTVGKGSFVAAYSYLLSGGEYELGSPVPLADQPGTKSRGPTRVGDNVWIAAHVVVADGTVIGDGSVIGAGAVVRGVIPPGVLAAGIPAKVIRKLSPS